jgi:hypothetical protein
LVAWTAENDPARDVLRIWIGRTVRDTCVSTVNVARLAYCNTVTSINRPGDQPGRPRTPNAAANASSAYSSPNSSRMTTANGARRPRYMRPTAAAICGEGCGHGAGCTDIKTRSYGRDEGQG